MEALRQVIAPDRILTDPEMIAGYRHDEAEWAPHGEPLAVVRPHDASEVQTVVRFCLDNSIPLVPRGAGTGLSGGANAIDGSIVLSFESMNRIIDIDPVERIAIVEPGVVNDDLRRACATHGLWYPPDPASAEWSTIGGNVATNAGGMCCVKYGVTRDYVLSVEVVTGTGEIVTIGHRTAKGVAGYDLRSLLVGSGGTLAVITQVALRLRPLQAPQRTIAGYFDSIVAAGEAVSAIVASGVTPSALELIDRHCLAAVDAWKKMGLSVDANVVLLGRSDAPGEAGEAEADQILACFEQAGATWAARSTDQEEADALFEARRLAYPALERLGPVLTEDVCVPRHLVPEMLARIESAGIRHDVHIANIAHAGDGNLHPLIITDPGDDVARERAQRAFEDILDDAIALGGTVTGEHGVGILKKRGMNAELGPVVVEMQRAVKAALDPRGILNPGKVVDVQPVVG